MKKNLLILVSALAILTVEFYVGYMMGRNSQIATVKVNNASSHVIRNASIEFYQGERNVSGIEQGKTKVGRFFCGEKNLYRLKVTLDNEKILFSASRFIAPGSLVEERVTDSIIVSVH